MADIDQDRRTQLSSRDKDASRIIPRPYLSSDDRALETKGSRKEKTVNAPVSQDRSHLSRRRDERSSRYSRSRSRSWERSRGERRGRDRERHRNVSLDREGRRGRSRSRSDDRSRGKFRDRSHEKIRDKESDRRRSRDRYKDRERDRTRLARSRDRHEERRERRDDGESTRRRDHESSGTPRDSLSTQSSMTKSAAPKSSVEDGGKRIAAMFGYSATNNPFGDPNLTQQFTWKKKIEKEIQTGKLSRVPTRSELAAQRDELMDEIERAKARRERREAEREEMERLRAEEMRLKDVMQYADWEEKEERFLRAQAVKRSLLRICDSRERPVDTLCKNRILYQTVADNDMEASHEISQKGINEKVPYDVIRHLSLEELQTLAEDLSEMLHARWSDENIYKYLECLDEICQDEIQRYKNRELGLASGTSLDSLRAVEEEIDSMFEGKTVNELLMMRKEVEGVLDAVHKKSGHDGKRGSEVYGDMPSSLLFTSKIQDGAIDMDYWKGVLKHLRVALAKARALKFHIEHLDRRLGQIEQHAGYATPDELLKEEAEQIAADVERQKALEGGLTVDDIMSGFADISDKDKLELQKLMDNREKNVDPSIANAAVVQYTNLPRDLSGQLETEQSLDMLNRRIDALRKRGLVLLFVPKKPAKQVVQTEEDIEAEFLDSMGNVLPSGAQEATFEDEIQLTEDVSSMDEDYLRERFRLRKPRFVNRVRTGYDWNQYNRVHYDRENPPPKTVQGYKFNIFYPDLIDKAQVPTFVLEPTDSSDYCIIRFRAGPPYEDIAFKIVNREWQHSRNSGFRCVFERGVLQLWFTFKRYRYRR